ncbi:MAG: CxxC-x17-CxxC domain-containing protein [Patescibacteria group bacterium]
MSYPRGNDSSGGWKGAKKFGGKPSPWKREGGRDSGARAALYPATCHACGVACEVPFRPNGKKPVYCRECFVPEGKEEGSSRSYGHDAPRERPSFSERPSFTPSRAPANDGSVDQLRQLNAKLDTIIALLQARGTDAAL